MEGIWGQAITTINVMEVGCVLGGRVVGTAGTRNEIALYGQMADAAGQSSNKRTNLNLWWQLSDSDGEVIVGAIGIGVGMARG